MAPPGQSSSRRLRLAGAWSRLVHAYRTEIWQTSLQKERSLKAVLFTVARVLSITVTVFSESRITSRAAALSFSSLLGLAPLLAVATLVAGFALGKNDPSLVANTLNRMIKVVAPQVAQYESITQSSPLVDTISNIVSAARSGLGGALGGVTLIFIVLLLFKSIEDAFNDIWGVRQGRSVLMRIVLYWTILTLGAVLFFTSVALLGAGTFVNVFMERLPGGLEWLRSLSWSLHVFSFTLLTAMLTLFYRVIPNTRVFWRTAFIGALVVAALLLANNFLAFLYVKRVVLERSLYGSLAILLVLMSGLYIFWLCVLTGGIVSYAVQNVHFRNSQAAWGTLSEAMRERLALVVFLTIGRRFRECLPPISASHLSAMLKVPTQLLNECLNRLVHLQLITTLRADQGETASDYLYQPSRPLNRITLHDFKTLDDNFGETLVGSALEHIDPLLSHYDAALRQIGEHAFFRKTLDELFAEHPFDESRPPFTLGQRRAET
ncbi:MAG TPA: YihY/virulence factor BrkB family protein [Opitutaceae bacterium]|nr:YihY/virulence factor BrkB family protein [Opitutaceae bacterium]